METLTKCNIKGEDCILKCKDPKINLLLVRRPLLILLFAYGDMDSFYSVIILYAVYLLCSRAPTY